MKVLKPFLLFLFIFTLSNVGVSQSFIYRDLPNNLRNLSSSSSIEIDEIKTTLFRNGSDLTTYLPKKYNTSGKIDYTNFLQKGIDQNSLVILPNFPILINSSGLRLKSNSKILFQKNSLLIVKANDKEFYSALNIENVSNVEVYFAKLKGDRKVHLSKSGEWGMGIYIIHSRNIKLYKSNISQFWGDGIYIGRNQGNTSQNIQIIGSILDNNRRNGISIISGNNVLIKNTVISNTNGTSPEYGIDLEPNGPGDIMQNIVFDNVISYNNNGGGVLFAFDNLQGGNKKFIGVSINKFDDYYSKNSFGFYFDRGYQKYAYPLGGNINITNVNLNQIKRPIETFESRKSNITVNISGLKINNKSKTNSEIKGFVKNIHTGINGILK
ncbi:right-handed parallel beta-helix repeat-containing protein [Sphingobacterium sp. 1.A.4]|uniref:right-handed parallel beta-helix repeat-containing protein n=1 Tax=Sphingobacterium sp. 1.A.4 TaxID=2044603 RepID=UPI000C0BC388|nr:right-handed parallel beta-helix repeat-containing protein [Sphingobacterium sp. 1.A.4]